jgi:cobaltochelatase CobN
MYEQIAEKYLLDPDVAAFMDEANRWAARSIAETLLQAAERGMWAAPADELLNRVKDRYLELEDHLEGAGV